MPGAPELPGILSCQDLAAPLLLAVPGGQVAAFTGRAPGKEGPNEDALAVLPCGAGGVVLAVADGMGGGPAGELAAWLALHELERTVLDACRQGAPLREAILHGFEEADRAVQESVAGATTLSVVAVGGGRFRPYHVGDSGVLLTGQRGRIKLLTIAHSPTGYAVEAGLLDPWEAMIHEERHVVSNMVGTGEMRIELGPDQPLAPRDTLVLASDGLFDNLHPEEIAGVVRQGPLDAAAGRLLELCRRRMARSQEDDPAGKPDDLSFLLYRPASPPGDG